MIKSQVELLKLLFFLAETRPDTKHVSVCHASSLAPLSPRGPPQIQTYPVRTGANTRAGRERTIANGQNSATLNITTVKGRVIV